MNIWNHAVITYKGLALQAKLIAGNTLEITKVVIGSGYVDEDLLRDQLAVTDPQKTLTQVASITYPEEGQCAIRIRITNEDVETDWTARQVGFYATDPDEGEILYFLAQADEGSGTVIPSDAGMYDYSAEWTFYFKYGQADNVTVVVDPSNSVSYAEMTSYVTNVVNDYIPKAQKGVAGGVATLGDDGRIPAAQMPEAKKEFDELADEYGYNFTITKDATGKRTITVDLSEESPENGTLIAEITKNSDGDTVVTVSITLRGTTTKSQHILDSDGGEGGPYNG